jgi:replicative DNA helicase
MDLMSQTFLRQQNVEKLFAAALYQFPLYTFTECRWLEPSKFSNEQIADFWEQAADQLEASMTDEQAFEIVTKIAMQSGSYLDFTDWAKNLSDMPMPKAYANEISRRHYISTVMQRLPEITAAIADGDDAELQNVLSQLAQTDIEGSVSVQDLVSVSETFEKRIQTSGHSVSTHLAPMDAALGGLELQTLTVLAGRPSMGKTALALYIVVSAAMSGTKSVIFSLEMSKTALWARLACPLVGLTWKNVRAGLVPQEKLDELYEASAKLAVQLKDNLFIVDGRQTTETIWRTCAQVNPELIVIDHLRLVKDKVGDNENKRLGIITETLKDLGKARNIAVLLLAQMNRKSEDRANDAKRPQLADLRDSGEIEENADVVLMMYRQSYYDEVGLPSGSSAGDPTEVWVRKFRDGEANVRINLLYDAMSNKFTPARLEEYSVRDITV